MDMLEPLAKEEQERTLAAFQARLENPSVKIERCDARTKDWSPHVNYLWDINEAHRIAVTENDADSVTPCSFIDEEDGKLVDAVAKGAAKLELKKRLNRRQLLELAEAMGCD